jgi:uncharacterized protein (TIRG00374 family)
LRQRQASGRCSSFSTLRLIARRHAVLFWVLTLALLAAVFVWRQQREVAEIGRAAGAADPRLLVLVLLINVGVVALAGLSYRLILSRLGHRVPWRDCAGIHLQRHMIGTITPVGGPASIYVLIRALGQRGISSTDALLVTTIRSAVGYTSFMLLLIPALALQRPSGIVLVGAGALLGLLALVLTALSLLLRGTELPIAVSRRLPSYLVRFVRDARAHGICPRDLAAPLGLALANNVAGAMAVFLALRALGMDVGPAAGLVGYAVGNLFQIMAPVFQGIGIVELTMSLALQQQGVPLAGAAAATLIYRLGDVWFVLGLGILMQTFRQPLVRRTTARVAPLAAGMAGAVLLLATPHVAFASAVVLPRESAPWISGFTAFFTMLASIALIGLSSGMWSRRSLRLAAQVVPLGLLVVAVPLFALASAGVNASAPF